MFSFDDTLRMRRYAFEAFITHLLWFTFFFALTGGFHMTPSAWIQSFFQWDARWYATMAQDGHGFLPQTYVFPPLHGWILGRATDLVFFFDQIFSSTPSWVLCFYPTSALIGFFSFACANTIFVILSERRWNIDRPRLWLAAVANPMGYFAFSAYSDHLFFALFLGTVALALLTSPRARLWKLPELSASHRRLANLSLAILCGTLPWIRLTGFTTAAWLMLKRKEALATLGSLVAFLLYYWIRTDDPMFFLFVQRVFQMPEGTAWTGLLNSVEIFSQLFTGVLFRGPDFFLYGMNFGIFPIFALILSIALVVWLARRGEFEWTLVISAATLLSHNQAFWRSTVRYTLPFFPLFYWMLLTPSAEGMPLSRTRRIVYALAIGVSFTLQVLYARLFQAGSWAF